MKVCKTFFLNTLSSKLLIEYNPKVEGTITEDQLNEISSMTNGYEVYENEEYLESTSIKEEPFSEEDTVLDLPLECMLCAKKLRTISGLKAHVIAEHNYKTVKRKAGSSSPSNQKKRYTLPDSTDNKPEKYVCSTCRRVFLTSTDLRVHETCHNKFVCFACNGKFDTFKEVTNHRMKCKIKPKMVKPKTLSDVMRERADALKLEVHPVTKHKADCECDLCIKKPIYRITANGVTRVDDKNNEEVEKDEEDEINKVSDKSRTIGKLNRIEESNELEFSIKKEKEEAEEEKYNKIEVELESIFEYAIEKKEVELETAKETQQNLEEALFDSNSDDLDDEDKVNHTSVAADVQEVKKSVNIKTEVTKKEIVKEIEIEVERITNSETNSNSETNLEDSALNDKTTDKNSNREEYDRFKTVNELEFLGKTDVDKNMDCDSKNINAESNTFVIERIEEIAENA